jgi:Family of unknown function (DUF6492)
MRELVLLCKSYRNDLLRFERLAHSIQQYNSDAIPFYVSVPERDLSLFAERAAGLNVTLIADESILEANPRMDINKVRKLPGGLSQQIIKSEFWRLNISKTYVCLDSDCIFIRPFYIDDFISPYGYPYTVIHEAKELLQFSINHGRNDIYENYHSMRAQLAEIIGRKGRHFDYGPVPVIWSSEVWNCLDLQFLQPRNLDFSDAILMLPSEILWYGEAMLKYSPFPVVPIEPLFRVYHTEEQFVYAQSQGETTERISRNYLGVCYQSNWQKEFDLKKKPLHSRAARWLRLQAARLKL